MQNNNPCLSIVMPVYNHPYEVKVMIDSVRASVLTAWELLVVDDGSDAETLALLKAYEKQDCRICVLHRERMPKGAQTCRNIGMEMAKGEFVCFFDSDDYVTPTCLRQRVQTLEAQPDLDFMVFRNGVLSEGGFDACGVENVFGCKIYDDDFEAFSQRTLPFVVWNNIYRRESLLKHEIRWDENLLSLQDAQFNLDCLLAGLRYGYASSPADYGYRTATIGSVSKNIQTKEHQESNLYAIRRFYEKVQERFGHKYDHALYRGAMLVYTKVARGRVERTFEAEMLRIICSHSRVWGMIFGSQVLLRRLLAYVLPNNVARRIATLSYIMWFRHVEQKWIPRRLRTLMVLLCLLLSMNSCSKDSVKREYELAWHDEFNGNELDTTIWSYIPRMHGVRSFCGLTEDKRMLQIRNGRMRMYARYNNGYAPNDTAMYLTTGLWSWKKATFTYGKIEVRAKMHGAVGAWPAIWTMPEERKTWDITSSVYTEIDIMEYVDRNDFVYQTAHNAYTLKDKVNWYKPVQQKKPKIKREKYNLYCVEILPDVVIFSINGKETHRYPKTKDNEKDFHYGILSHLRMNTQAYPPAFWSGGLKPRTFPGWMDIDYVRVYNLKNREVVQ